MASQRYRLRSIAAALFFFFFFFLLQPLEASSSSTSQRSVSAWTTACCFVPRHYRRRHRNGSTSAASIGGASSSTTTLTNSAGAFRNDRFRGRNLFAPLQLTKSTPSSSSLSVLSNRRGGGGGGEGGGEGATTLFAKTPQSEQEDGGQETASADDSSSSSSSSLGWLLTLCLPLWLVYVSNQWSRSSLYYLVDFSSGADPSRAMNADIGFDEGRYGLLASVAFTALFAVASLGAGVASDRYDRKLLTVGSAVAWSVATIGTAYSHSYPEVVAFRIAMGLACAFSTPTAYTLLQERVPANRQSLASSLYGTGVSVASGLASLSILLDNQFGWRHALELIAVFGFASAGISALTLPSDDKPNSAENEEAPTKTVAEEANSRESSIFSDVADIVSTSRVRWIFLGSFLRFCSGLCIGVWSAPFYRMTYAGSESSYSVVQAFISVVGASASGLLGGVLADWLASTAGNDENDDAVGRKLWVPVVGSLLAAPTWYFAVQTDQPFQIAMAWLAAEYFVAECWFGPTISTLQSTVRPGSGGTAQGLFTLTGAIANLAPSVLGYLYGQATSSSSNELSALLTAVVCFGYVSSAACFAVAAKSPPPPPTLAENLKKE